MYFSHDFPFQDQSMAFSTPKLTPGGTRADQDQISSKGRRRRRMALLLLILLLMFGSYLLGRDTDQAPTAPVVFDTPDLAPAPSTTAPTPAPAPKTVAPAPVVTAPPPATTPAPSAPSITVAAATQAAPVKLLEVSVGTRTRGGLTLKFDNPVSWAVSDNLGKGDAQVDIQGVHDLDSFPRNLPLPPGVKVIHAGIVDADTLHLRFTLQKNVRAFAAPADGPSTILSLFFRTAAEGSAPPALPQSIQSSGGCGNGASVTSAKAITLLQRSLDKNPAYADVRTALSLLEICTGDGSKAELLLAQSLKAGNVGALRLTVADAALRFARGDTGGALQLLRSYAADANGDAGYAELMADLQAATR
jgi:hypothetical protein